jgi:hypothetical protein
MGDVLCLPEIRHDPIRSCGRIACKQECMVRRFVASENEGDRLVCANLLVHLLYLGCWLGKGGGPSH